MKKSLNIAKIIFLFAFIFNLNASEKVFDYIEDIKIDTEQWLQFYNDNGYKLDLSSLELVETGLISEQELDGNICEFMIRSVRDTLQLDLRNYRTFEQIYSQNCDKTLIVIDRMMIINNGLLIPEFVSKISNNLYLIAGSKRESPDFYSVLLIIDLEFNEYLIYGFNSQNNKYPKGFLTR